MSKEFCSFEALEYKGYTGEAIEVDVDRSGFYETSVFMEDLCYCVGAVSIHEDGIYAAHVSPGELGSSVGRQMEDFEEGIETYVVAGIRSLEERETLETVIGAIDEEEVFRGSEFAINMDGELFSHVKDKPTKSFLL